MNEQIKEVMQKALLFTSKEKQIDLRKLSIVMRFCEKEKVVCEILNGEDNIGNLSWKSILGLKFIAFKNVIINSISGKINKISKDNNLPLEDVRVRVYAISNLHNAEPQLHLFSLKKPLKPININELI